MFSNKKIIKETTLDKITSRIEQESKRGWRQISEIKFFESFGGTYQVLLAFEQIKERV